jgi:hypothetical protein
MVNVSTQDRSAAALDGAHGLAVARWDALVEPSPVLVTMPLEDRGQLYHARSAMSRVIVSTAAPSHLGVGCGQCLASFFLWPLYDHPTDLPGTDF